MRSDSRRPPADFGEAQDEQAISGKSKDDQTQVNRGVRYKAKGSPGLAAAIVFVFALSSSANADTEPTMKQIYEAATTGHLNKASVPPLFPRPRKQFV